MIVQGVVVHCSTGCGADATVLVRVPGGGLAYCDAHRPAEKKRCEKCGR